MSMTSEKLVLAITKGVADEIAADNEPEDVNQAMIDHYNWLYSDDIKTGFRKQLTCIS